METTKVATPTVSRVCVTGMSRDLDTVYSLLDGTEWKDGCRRVDGWVGGWMSGWVGGWEGGWVDGWVGGCGLAVVGISFDDTLT